MKKPVEGKKLYIVVQKVWTSAEIVDPCEFENFYLVPYDDGASAGRRSWLAVRAIESSSWREAYSQCSQDLILLIDSLHVVLQCVFSLAGASWCVWQLYDGPPGILIARLVQQHDFVPMSLWREEHARDVQRLRKVDRSALLYFRESSRASTAKTKLAMLVIAAEALAGSQGKISKCNRCGSSLICPDCQCESQYRATDMGNVKLILGIDLFKAFYKGPENLRNKLMHGNVIDEQRARDLADAAYKQIRLFLQSQFELESDIVIANAPRPLEGPSITTVCLRPPADWLPTPINLGTVDWARTFRDLESADLETFGERVKEPSDL